MDDNIDYIGRGNTATFYARRHIVFGTNVPVDVIFVIYLKRFDDCVNNTLAYSEQCNINHT